MLRCYISPPLDPGAIARLHPDAIRREDLFRSLPRAVVMISASELPMQTAREVSHVA